MKLILRADVDSLGRLGDIVTVKPGFGRNYLIPQGLGMIATEANLKQFELERKKLAAKADSLRAEANELAAKIAAATPKGRQTLLFTATMDDPMARLAQRLLTEPERIAKSRSRE
ncbi:MAG: 50S ribosomal protein L9, partial [Deltaproteobacteria bacterium]|nr:50S ribosomal protein L9 [Deltaproteobacteria bacterium]